MFRLTIVLQARLNQPQHGSLLVSRKGLVTLGRFPCAILCLACRQSDWLGSHDFELILKPLKQKTVVAKFVTHASTYN